MATLAEIRSYRRAMALGLGPEIDFRSRDRIRNSRHDERRKLLNSRRVRRHRTASGSVTRYQLGFPDVDPTTYYDYQEEM